MPSNETASTPSPAEIEAIGYLTGAVRGYERAGGSAPVIVVPVGYVRTLLAALAEQEAARRESAWLIEADGPSWWTGRTTDRGAFDTDPNEAVRFTRREDADRVKHWLLSEHAFALRTTEHVWLDAAIQSTPTGAQTNDSNL